MQIRFSNLKDKLAKPSLAPMLISGDEPYQHMLASDMYRKRAQELGFSERKILTVETGFDWSELLQERNNMSLFGERTLVDLRIPNGKPGAAGSKAIINFVENLYDDVMLLIQVPKLDRNTMNSAWVKTLDKVGVVLRVWPLNELETQRWVQQKLKTKGFAITNEIVEFITQQVEGNLLAAMQEIEKIELISESKKLDLETVQAMLTNSARYSLNEFMDETVKGKTEKIIRILDGLKKEDVATPLLLWGLTEQVRRLVDTKYNVSAVKAKNRHNILQKLSELHQYYSGISEKDQDQTVYTLLKQCARVDRVIKGRAYGDPWRELLQLSLATRQQI